MGRNEGGGRREGAKAPVAFDPNPSISPWIFKPLTGSRSLESIQIRVVKTQVKHNRAFLLTYIKGM